MSLSVSVCCGFTSSPATRASYAVHEPLAPDGVAAFLPARSIDRSIDCCFGDTARQTTSIISSP